MEIDDFLSQRVISGDSLDWKCEIAAAHKVYNHANNNIPVNCKPTITAGGVLSIKNICISSKSIPKPLPVMVTKMVNILSWTYHNI